LVSQAEKAATNGDLEGEIRLLEQALKVEPDHRKALFMLAEVIQQRAANLVRPRNSPLYLQSARAIRRLRETYKTLTPQERQVLATLLYNEACTFAIEDQPEKALDSLAESIDAGFALRDKLATDKELDPIRKSPRFEELMKRVERALAEEKALKLAAGTIPFPFRFALPDLDGKTVTLDDVKGNVTIVTFWGTWCAPCRREVPRYKALLAKYRDRGLKVVGITYERPEVEDVNHKVRAFVEKHGIPYPCPIGDDQTRGLVPNFQGYPTTLFLDHSSTVRVKVAGECALPEMEAIVELVIRSGEGSR
jgi:thiol-disulfide isomerase/thioredoxin